MPKPFPSSLYIGTDICNIPRIASLVNKYPTSFYHRLFTKPELAAYSKIFNPDTKINTKISQDRKTQFIAGRWAAKEAIIKACGYAGRRGVGLKDVVILPLDYDLSTNKTKTIPNWIGDKQVSIPLAVVLQPLSSTDNFVKRWNDGEEVRISISHDGDYATAVAMVADLRPTRGGRSEAEASGRMGRFPG